jgi:hypothetical protein
MKRSATRSSTKLAGGSRRGLVCGACVVVLLGGGARALAWDAATTHAGMTERALAASRFHAVLAHQLGRALGPFEPLKLDANAIDADVLRVLNARLQMLDPAGGYRPSSDGVLTALGWVEAGAVLEKTPPERGRHHFFEPGKRAGLDDGPGLSGTIHAARLTLGSGATVRDAATGTAFDLEGMPATEWIVSAQNDLGLQTFFDNWQLAVSAKEPSRREAALVRALVAMGGVLSVLEDMGQPAFVRNDFRGDFRDAGSEFETFVADRYGSVSLPRPSASVRRPSIEGFFAATDGKGLAQMTQRRFFSQGSLPRDFVCVAGDTPSKAAELVNQSLRFAEPKLDVLDLRPSEGTRYVIRDGIKIAAYRRAKDTIHFFFDRAVYADVARTWLPEATAYVAGLADHLMRGVLQIAVSADLASLTLLGAEGRLEPGTVAHVFSEDETGLRQEIGVAPLRDGSFAPVHLPKGTHKLAAFIHGRDDAGELVATGELTLP